jgi:serine/threonine-protein kinase
VLSPGEIINNDFKILKKIKNGGMSVIYLGKQQSLNRDVVIKEMTPGKSGMTSQEMAPLFTTEANLLATLQHPQIPSVYSHFKYEIPCYYYGIY